VGWGGGGWGVWGVVGCGVVGGWWGCGWWWCVCMCVCVCVCVNRGGGYECRQRVPDVPHVPNTPYPPQIRTLEVWPFVSSISTPNISHPLDVPFWGCPLPRLGHATWSSTSCNNIGVEPRAGSCPPLSMAFVSCVMKRRTLMPYRNSMFLHYVYYC
jgi:hypothetical protein